MKNLILVGFLLFITTVSFGQVATIKDKDGWTNVRLKPDGNSEIIYKVYENDVFSYDFESTDEIQDWISIYIPKNKFSLGESKPDFIVGFIHKSRLLPLDSLNKPDDNKLSFHYCTSEFKSDNRILDKEEDKWLTHIDGRQIWGVDGGYPKTQVDSIELSIDNKAINVNRVLYSDIFECDDDFDIYKNQDTYFVYQWNSDGAGAYAIVWVIDDSGIKQRFVAHLF